MIVSSRNWAASLLIRIVLVIWEIKERFDMRFKEDPNYASRVRMMRIARSPVLVTAEQAAELEAHFNLEYEKES